MKLYKDVEREAYEKAKREYTPVNLDIFEKDRFVVDESINVYYCMKGDSTWFLSKKGWVSTTNPYHLSELIDSLIPVSFTEICRVIQERKEADFFYDFVEI